MIDFIFSRWGQLAFALALGIWMGWRLAAVDLVQHRLDQVRVELAAANVTIRSEREYREQAERRFVVFQQRLADYEKSLSNRDACLLSDNDAAWLRSLTIRQ